MQFEDFSQQHAYPLLERYRDQLCTFNDDIQGTAAVVVAAVIAATKVAKVLLKDQRVAVLGGGSAGCGISEQIIRAMVNEGLAEAEARSHFYIVDRNGLLHDGMSSLLPFQQKLTQPQDKLTHWKLENSRSISLLDVINNAKPTILIGVSGQPSQFTEPMVRAMSNYCQRPIIFPLSNPTSREEATPQDVLNWSAGRALVATGSPFDPVTIDGREIHIAQSNNSYIFPGVGLGVVAGKARRVTDSMMMAAAIALSDLAPAMITGEGRLLPELTSIREVSKHIAKAVILQGIREGHVDAMSEAQVEKAVKSTLWSPEYEPFEA